MKIYHSRLTPKIKGGDSMEINKRKSARAELISELYDIPLGTLANMRSKREGPRFYKRGRRVIYFLEDVEKWIRKNPVLTKDSI